MQTLPTIAKENGQRDNDIQNTKKETKDGETRTSRRSTDKLLCSKL